MLAFRECEEQLNMPQIEAMEDYIGLSFPIEYKAFLLCHNGGRCNPNTFEFIENGRKTTSSIDWFLAIYSGEYDNLKHYIDILKCNEKRLPTHIIPIAHDALGKLICISCGAQDYGTVYFWDHEKEVDYNKVDDSDYSNLYFISGNFNEFLNSLR